jgi:triacylglycerol lipase
MTHRRMLMSLFVAVFTVSSSPSFAGNRLAGQTIYPIVLAHGMAGFDTLFGVYEYFYRIPEAMRAEGSEVYLTRVSSFNETERRAEQLLDQIEYIIAATGAEKVNIIGHSHGGLDARYAFGVRPELFASVTTVNTPHKGAELADFLRDHIEDGSFTEDVLAFFGDTLMTAVALLTGSNAPQDVKGTLDSLTSKTLEAFNRQFPAGVPDDACGSGDAMADGVPLFSWSGTRVTSGLFNVCNAPLLLTSRFYDEDNDGLVGRCSSHFGTVVRDDYKLNHCDSVNQVFGMTPWFGSDPRAVFKNHASRLKALGL